ncbi:rhodanese-related sulfurtransferase/predicted transcriptional regulator [Paenibacillus sp. V4I9]|uniref:ArsR/SmtB family transcription factor n=1 Tax=Paenibacillus sp. V4I9 TaxID=3042308 RepID=UPI00277EE2A0|nr:metalloregulator ArsR/SmtB family transcription factor [Paenibacillus sp. V4I9]MDQ0891569.1 rhodanese-related sulfurtransferase/predicted transcriptional regulator [Paenibacillus sp. V4I9]
MESVPIANTSAKEFKSELFQQLARVGKCLSSDKRLEVLSLLAQGPKSVEKLAQVTEMSVANVSRHLQVLLDARLVKFSKKGTYVIYSLADPSIGAFLFALWSIGESQLADVTRIKQEFLHEYKDIRTLSLEEARTKMEAGAIILLDVRPRDEYEAGHLAGAISIPMEELEPYLQNLPRPVEVVVYCRGPYCISSTQAVAKLQREGITAYKLEGGEHEWLKEAN